ncbi:single-stranded DNA-binding protein [Candidatus Kaiserbacteria bacterium]|nr:single-stranded DNA-binding protein [Candidatus Kaiserbacteria bacterium]
MYLNKVLIYGNLTRDPEVKSLPSGTQVCSFSLATNRVYKDKDGQKQEAVEYHNVVAFARPAELIGQYMKKGRPLFVEGRLQTRSWDKDGQKQYRTEIVVDNFQFGDGGSGRGGATGGDSAPRTSEKENAGAPADGGPVDYPEEEINPDDIPF